MRARNSSQLGPLAWARFALLEVPQVLRACSSAKEVPNGRVAAEVPIKVLVMLIVEGRCDEPACEPRTVPPAWQELVAAMDVGPHDQVGRSDECHGAAMNREE